MTLFKIKINMLIWITVTSIFFTILFPMTTVSAATEFTFSNNLPSQIPVGQKYKFDLHGLAPRDFSWIDTVDGPGQVTLSIADGPEKGQKVAGKTGIYVSQIGNMIVFKPDSKLALNTQYVLQVPESIVKDNKTGELNAQWSKTFQTVGQGDSVLNPPVVYPFPYTANIPINTNLTVEFGEVIYTTTPDLEKITLVDNSGNNIPFNARSNTKFTGLMISPLISLQKDTTYTLTVPPSTIEDSEQNTNQEAISTTFTTGSKTYLWPEPAPGPSPVLYPDPVLLMVIEISPAGFTLNQGESLQLKATGKYDDGTAFDVTNGVTWTSSDSSVVKVNVNGVITALAPGTVQLNAALYGITTSILITVNASNKVVPDIDSDPRIVKPDEPFKADFHNGSFGLEAPAGTFTTENEVIVKAVNLNSELAQGIKKASQGFARQIFAIYLIQAKDTKTNQRIAKFNQEVIVKLKQNKWGNKGIYMYDPAYKTLIPLKSTYQAETGVVSFPVQYANPLAVIEEKPVTFQDIKGFQWAKSHIEFLSKKNIINGVAKDRFAPGAYLTRGQLAKVLALAVGISSESGPGFTDIQQNYWANPFISSIKNAGIVAGYPDGSYKPENYVTRAEMVKMVLGAVKIKTETTDQSKFKDRGHWADDYIAAAVRKEIINGYPDGTFRPDKLITRAEAAKVIAKAYALQAE